MHNDLLTYICPNYNGEKFIEQCIDSIIKQSCSSWKLIICDDCSTDQSFDLIKKNYSEHPNIRIINNSENHHYIRTLRRLIGEVNTPYFAIIDNDDALSINATEVVLDYITRFPDVGLFYSNRYYCNAKLKIIFNTDASPRNRTTMYGYVNHIRVFKKSIYMQTDLYDEKYFLAEDQDITYKMEEQAKVMHIPHWLYFYRHRSDSQSHDQVRWCRSKTSHIMALLSAYNRRESEGLEHLKVHRQELMEIIKKLRSYRQLSVSRYGLVHTLYMKMISIFSWIQSVKNYIFNGGNASSDTSIEALFIPEENRIIQYDKNCPKLTQQFVEKVFGFQASFEEAKVIIGTQADGFHLLSARDLAALNQKFTSAD